MQVVAYVMLVYVSHVLQQITIRGVGGGGDYLPMKKRTVIKIITKTKLLRQ